jgi:D-alanyl-D-alanine carboxypeptidase
MQHNHSIVPVNEAAPDLLQETLHQLVSMKGVHHAVMSVESRDGSFCWSGAKGNAQPDGTPMEADTPFWIASITKMFIAATILRLQEAGALSIDNTVISYLPEEMLRGVHVVRGVDYYDQLTLRHLLSHASGIPDYLEIKDGSGKTLIDRVFEGDDTPWSIHDILEIIREAKKPLFEPKSPDSRRYQIRYSDTNFQLLIAVIEAVTKSSFSEALSEMLLRPLDLAHTYHPGGAPLSPTKPVSAVWVQEKPFQPSTQVMSSIGDLNSTAADLISFMRALLDGRVFSKPGTLELMMGKWHTLSFALSPITPSWPIQYGMGMMRFQLPRFMTPFNPTPPVIGHSGAVGSWLFYCHSLNLIFTGTVSQLTAAATPFRVIPKLIQKLEKLQ